MRRLFMMIIIFIILALTTELHAGPVTLYYGYGQPGASQQSVSGGTTQQTIQPTVANPSIINPDFSPTFTPTIVPPPEAPPEVPAVRPPAPAGAEIGAQALYSTHVKVYSIPASYSFTENLKMEMTIPYVEKTLKGEYTGQELTARGLGDVSVGVKFRYGDERGLYGLTDLRIKLPTGEERQFANSSEQLALGTGSYDFAFNQAMSIFINKFRLIGSLGYIITKGGEYTETDNKGRKVMFENRAGNVFNYFLGGEYDFGFFRGLVTYLNVTGMFIERSHIRETDTSTNALIRDEYRKDRLRTLDINPGVRVMLYKKYALRLGVVIPVLTSFDPEAVEPQPRDVVFDVGLGGKF